jgi:glycosyltransferase involved in cell wall biosynthesis
MRVCIDLTPSVQSQAGLGRYAAELTRALITTRPPDEHIELFYTDPRRRQPPPPLDQLPGRRLSSSSKSWRFSVLLAYLFHHSQDAMIESPDVFYATDHLLPYLTYSRAVFTLGDVTFVSHAQTHSRLNRIYLQLMMPHFLRQADAVIAISRCTLREASQLYSSAAAKGQVIYPAVSAHFRPIAAPSTLKAIRSRYGLPPKFLLFVGTIEPRKNLTTLFEAFKATQVSDVKLVIAGKRGWLYDETFARLRELGLEQRAVFTGFVPDEDLPALYTMAEAFVFPSLYEGFGLPVLEAMACGAPVLCSNTSSLPEVAGDAALLISPGDVRDWAQAIEQITRDATLRADLRQRGLRQAQHFSWEETARQTRQVYRDVYAAHRP